MRGVLLWQAVRPSAAGHGKRERPPGPALCAGPLISVDHVQCSECPWRDVCKLLVKEHLPVLCERLTEGEAEALGKALEVIG